VQSLFDDKDQDDRGDGVSEKREDEPFILAGYAPETAGETVRRTGLAWSAGIAFFGAIVFMLFLGWIVDLLLGSSPWGLVGGIIFGSIIGFLQFFRITSRIFHAGPSIPAEHPLLPDPTDAAPARDPFDQP
jgi:F0F1-type ATP synthase assembly protein I